MGWFSFLRFCSRYVVTRRYEGQSQSRMSWQIRHRLCFSFGRPHILSIFPSPPEIHTPTTYITSTIHLMVFLTPIATPSIFTSTAETSTCSPILSTVHLGSIRETRLYSLNGCWRLVRNAAVRVVLMNPSSPILAWSSCHETRSVLLQKRLRCQDFSGWIVSVLCYF